MTPSHRFGAVAALAAALAAPSTFACSTCKCGDYTITLLGTEKPYAGRLRVGLDYLNRAETLGEPGVDERSVHESRLVLGAAWSPWQDFTFAAQVPYVRKTVRDTTTHESQSAEGIGDTDFLVRWVALRLGGASGRHLAGVRAGVRAPTVQASDGVDVDTQPDAGAWAPNLGLWYGYYRFPWFLGASATYYRFEDGRQHFSPGDVLTVSVLGQYAVSPEVALQLGVDAKDSGGNSEDSNGDPDSGGSLGTVYTGLVVRFLDDLLFSAGGQVPVLNRLHGHQDEDPSLRLGIAYDF